MPREDVEIQDLIRRIDDTIIKLEMVIFHLIIMIIKIL